MVKYRLQFVATLLLAAGMVSAGVFHFMSPEPFAGIIPSVLPYHRILVFVSGFFEIMGGIGLLTPFARKAASIGLIVLFIAVFPANVNMAIHNVAINGRHFAPWVLWLRLPLQAVLIIWAWWCGQMTRPLSGAQAGIKVASDE
jgi:uncharacterized membrane protein